MCGEDRRCCYGKDGKLPTGEAPDRHRRKAPRRLTLRPCHLVLSSALSVRCFTTTLSLLHTQVPKPTTSPFPLYPTNSHRQHKQRQRHQLAAQVSLPRHRQSLLPRFRLRKSVLCLPIKHEYLCLPCLRKVFSRPWPSHTSAYPLRPSLPPRIYESAQRPHLLLTRQL